LKDGNAKSWFENGQKWMDYTHWNDKRDGPLVWWYENGQKRQEGNYKGGMRFGEWTYYQEDGKILYRKIFRDGQPISTKYGKPSENK
jgi:antitoxin component YwqK of YwqJK toxin-antitoxin module